MQMRRAAHRVASAKRSARPCIHTAERPITSNGSRSVASCKVAQRGGGSWLRSLSEGAGNVLAPGQHVEKVDSSTVVYDSGRLAE